METETMARRETVMTRILDLFEDHALRALWLPVVRITRAPESGKNPGCLYVKRADDLSYVGKILPDGEARFIGAMLTGDIRAELYALARGGTDYLAETGAAVGVCCYCGRTLTDPDSVELGYGPVCAEKYAVPHPNRHGF